VGGGGYRRIDMAAGIIPDNKGYLALAGNILHKKVVIP